MHTEILLPVDLGHPESWRKALPTAIHYAKSSNARIHLLTVVPDYGKSIVGSFFPSGHEEEVMEHALKALHEFSAEHLPGDIPKQHIVGHGPAYDEILRYAEKTNCDLIILASHRPEMQDYLLGPTSAKVVRHAKCSVLVVRE